MVKGAPRSEVKHERRLGILLALEPAQRAHLVAHDRVRARGARLDPADVQCRLVEVDLSPAQVDQLADPQTVAIGDKDHGRVAVAPAVVLGRPDQALDLGLGEVLARPIGSVRPPAVCDCSLFDGWSHEFEVLFGHGFLSLFTVYC